MANAADEDEAAAAVTFPEEVSITDKVLLIELIKIM